MCRRAVAAANSRPERQAELAEYFRRYHIKHRKKRLKNHRRWWKLNGPSRIPVQRETSRASRFKNKLKALQLISGSKVPSCCSCNTSDIRILVINHLNGGGRKEQLEFGVNKMVRRICNGVRDVKDLNVLCHNCNILYEYQRGTMSLPKGWKSIYETFTAQ